MVDDELSHPCHPPSSFPIFPSLLPYHHSFNPVSNLFSGAFVRKFSKDIFSHTDSKLTFWKKRETEIGMIGPKLCTLLNKGISRSSLWSFENIESQSFLKVIFRSRKWGSIYRQAPLLSMYEKKGGFFRSFFSLLPSML